MLDDLGNWSSIIGLTISIVVLLFSLCINVKVKKIKKRIMFNTRVTPLLSDFKTHTRQIKVLYEDFDNNKNQLKVEMVKCRVQLESIVPSLQNDQKNEFDETITILKKIENSKLGTKPENFKQKWYLEKTRFQTSDDIWELYVKLVACVNKLDNFIKDKKII